MEINHNLKLSLLFELYGNLLTEKQGSFLKDFLDLNFSLSEIAEINESSRQSVNDLIKRSLKKLEEYEGKLHFFEKFEKVKIHANNCLTILSKNEFSKQEVVNEINKLLEVL